ncbi:MAG: flagellar hook-associated protein FlgL [Planctomycetaceae bacterium]
MLFRVTQGQSAAIALRHLQQQTADLQKTQQQLSTGLRLQRPSDDPIAVRKSLIQQDGLSRLESQLAAMQHAESRLSQAHVQLREAHQLYVRARELALSARQSLDSSERDVFAAEVQGILDQLVSVANSTDESGFLFSGTATDIRPFTVSNDGTGVTYNGTPSATSLYLSNDITRDSLVSGDRIFQPASRQPSVIEGTTGAAIGGN